MSDENEMLKRVGEEAFKRGKMEGMIWGLVTDYRYKEEVPDFVIDDLEAVIDE